MQKNSAPSDSSIVTPPTQADISRRASAIWESYGRPQGRDLEIWLEAERQLLGVDSQVEGRHETAIVARSFDEATAGGKPRSRVGGSAAAERKSDAPSSARSRR